MVNKLKTKHCELSATDTMMNIVARLHEDNRATAEIEFIHELTLVAVEKSLKKAGFKTDKL